MKTHRSVIIYLKRLCKDLNRVQQALINYIPFILTAANADIPVITNILDVFTV
jgi:hypothetical protein